MEPLEFGKFVVQTLQWFWDRCTIVTECKRGEAVIKRRFGSPIKWRSLPRLYWKWPFVDMFDRVDMRRRYMLLNAHSFHATGMEKSLVPYNIIIDFQVEYQVMNPLVIYDEYGFAQNEDSQISYINNAVQQIIAGAIREYGISLTYEDLEKHIDQQVKEDIISDHSVEPSIDDNFFRKNKGKNHLDRTSAKDKVSINAIVITSFDKNISLRTTV